MEPALPWGSIHAMFTGNILLLNRDPVFCSQTWEIFDMWEGLSTKIVRRPEDMVALVQTHPFDLLVFDDEREENLQMAITFCHHFPNHQYFAILGYGVKPKQSQLVEAKKRRIRVIRRSDNWLLMREKLGWDLRRVRRQMSRSGAAISADIGYALTGDMTIFSAADILQMACISGRNGRFTFISSHGRAEIFIHNGNITHAERHAEKGEPVLAQIFRWDHGRFYFEEGRQTAEHTIKRKFDHVLVDALKQKDEAEMLQEPEALVQ